MSPRSTPQAALPEVIELDGVPIDGAYRAAGADAGTNAGTKAGTDASTDAGAGVGSGRGTAAALRALLVDRGLHYGDGLFETIACRRGVARFLDWHLERLALGCERLGIALGSLADLAADIERLAAGAERALIKVLVTRGPATARGYASRGDERPTRVVLRYGWPDDDPSAATLGVAVRIADLKLGENPKLAGLKHLNRLELVLARAELRGSSCAEALLFSSGGSLISGTMSNVFLAAGGELATPRLDTSGVAGVMRRVVLDAAPRAGLTVREGRLTRADLDRAEEVFLTNARIGIWPVRAIDTRALAPGRLTRQMQTLLEPLLGEPHA